MASNKEIGEKFGIHPRDVEKIKFAFEVYDFKGDGKVDKFYIGDLIRACNLNPTNKTIVEIGGQSEKGKGVLTMDDMYPLFKKGQDHPRQRSFQAVDQPWREAPQGRGQGLD